MELTLAPALLSFGMPLLTAVALLLLVPAGLAQQSRLGGAVTVFGALLLCAALMLLATRSPHFSGFSMVDGTLASVMLLVSVLAIAPLLDRARPASLMLVAPLAAYGVLTVLFSFGASSSVILSGSIIAASITALIGSALLPAHPARYTVSGQLRGITNAQATSLSGWALLAAGFVALGIAFSTTQDWKLVAFSAIVAALSTVLTTRAEDALAKSGEAIAAAVLLTLFAPLTLPLAALLGLAASFSVNRSEIMALALRVDDPQHLLGALLVPAIGALLLPGLLDVSQLAACIRWLAVAGITGLALAALLWPFVMLFTGLALPKRRVLEGVRA